MRRRVYRRPGALQAGRLDAAAGGGLCRDHRVPAERAAAPADRTGPREDAGSQRPGGQQRVVNTEARDRGVFAPRTVAERVVGNGGLLAPP